MPARTSGSGCRLTLPTFLDRVGADTGPWPREPRVFGPDLRPVPAGLGRSADPRSGRPRSAGQGCPGRAGGRAGSRPSSRWKAGPFTGDPTHGSASADRSGRATGACRRSGDVLRLAASAQAPQRHRVARLPGQVPVHRLVGDVQPMPTRQPDKPPQAATQLDKDSTALPHHPRSRPNGGNVTGHGSSDPASMPARRAGARHGRSVMRGGPLVLSAARARRFGLVPPAGRPSSRTAPAGTLIEV
jgi:hypothetical protein